MVVGMMLFYPLLTLIFDGLGLGDVVDAAVPKALIMATGMTLGMSPPFVVGSSRERSRRLHRH
jgi:hypothetical protein